MSVTDILVNGCDTHRGGWVCSSAVDLFLPVVVGGGIIKMHRQFRRTGRLG